MELETVKCIITSLAQFRLKLLTQAYSVKYLFRGPSRLEYNPQRCRALVLQALLVAGDALAVQVPVAQVVRVPFAKTLQMVGEQDKATLNHQQVDFRVL